MKPIKKPTKAKTASERQRARRQRLDAIAQTNGFDSWTKLETAVLAGGFIVARPNTWPTEPTQTN